MYICQEFHIWSKEQRGLSKNINLVCVIKFLFLFLSDTTKKKMRITLALIGSLNISRGPAGNPAARYNNFVCTFPTFIFFLFSICIKWWWWVAVMSNSCNPQTVACQDPLSMGFSRWEYGSRLPFPSPEDCPNPGIKPQIYIAGRFFTNWTMREALYVYRILVNKCCSMSNLVTFLTLVGTCLIFHSRYDSGF